HVAGRAEGVFEVGHAAVGPRDAGQAEVGQHGRQVVPLRGGSVRLDGQQDVARLDVAVDDVAGVGVVDGLGDQLDEAGGQPRWLRPLLDEALQRAALDEVHGEV